jgi:protein involved in polysaccharide export with SLBB domain
MARACIERRRRFGIGRSWCALLAAGLSLPAGCASTIKHEEVAKALGSGVQAPTNREETVAESYRLACPDVVEIAVDSMPQAGGRFAVDAEGRIALAVLENARVEGETVASLAKRVATGLGLEEDRVSCRVVQHQSRVVFVHGPINKGDRSVPYRGTENIVSFLRRCGGLMPSADVDDVHVVRGNVAHGVPPQVFAVDLAAILLRGEPGTNVLLQPFDEIYIGERPRAKFGEALPHWLRPIYRGFCGLFPGACAHDWRQQIRDPEP